MTYQLIHGDCLEVLPTLEAGSIDAVVTDPPYGTTACAWDTVIPFAPMWTAIKHVVKPTAAVVLFGSQPFTSALVMSNPQWFKYAWVWVKNNATGFSHCANMPLKNIEDVAVFSSGIIQHGHLTNQRMAYNPQNLLQIKMMNRRGSKGFSGTMERKSQSNHYQTEFTNYPRMTLYFDGAIGTEHPTQKPIELLRYLIRTYTNPGDTVLDFTMGSGSTIVAAIMEGRNAIGIEIDKGYYDIACRRCADAAAQPRLLDVEPARQVEVQVGFDAFRG